MAKSDQRPERLHVSHRFKLNLIHDDVNQANGKGKFVFFSVKSKNNNIDTF